MIAALVRVVLAALNIPVNKVSLLPLGLAFSTLAMPLACGSVTCRGRAIFEEFES